MKTTIKAFLATLAVICLLGIFPATVAADQVANDNTGTELNVTIISPNGGEIWENGKTYTITWEQKNIDMITIFLQRDSIGRYIVSGYPVDINAEFESYDYTVPENVPEADNYKIWIIAYQVGFGQASDYSDSNFSVVKTEPEPVSDLMARAKNTKVSLVWTPPLEAVSTNFYRASENGDFEFLATTTSTYATYLDKSVPYGNYTYMVRSVTVTGQETPDSNLAEVSIVKRQRL